MTVADDVSDLCSHIANGLQDASIVNKYKMVVTWNAQRYHGDRNSAKRRKIAIPSCGTCNTHLARPFACLHCDFIGCWKEGHILDHLNNAGHFYAVDAKSGRIFCSVCDDLAYHPDLDKLHLVVSLAAEEAATKYQMSKRSRAAYEAWKPLPEDLAALSNSETIPCYSIRGLLNLGQTCFLNVVLQCFIHNPLLRNYFLADKHNSKLCYNGGIDCTCCEMDRLFTELYMPNNSIPFGPTSFLHTTWKKSSELSGYAQQDAHEFFQSTLNQIHLTSRGNTNVSCNCIIHTTFAGQLQSDVRCERCGNVTSTVDPMLDISLELRERNANGNGRKSKADEENTLASCLKKFTLSEKLGTKDYGCSKCGRGSHASKRLSIRKLPPVLSFQFKRFEQKGNDKGSAARKMDSLIRFPATINMRSFTTLALSGDEIGGPDIMYEYDLFAVINHEGQMNNGHYTNFARCGDEWYRFDDDKVTRSTVAACLDNTSCATAYMCFYVKRHLEYKANPVVNIKPLKVKEEKVKNEAKSRVISSHLINPRLSKEDMDKELEDALLATV